MEKIYLVFVQYAIYNADNRGLPDTVQHKELTISHTIAKSHTPA